MFNSMSRGHLFELSMRNASIMRGLWLGQKVFPLDVELDCHVCLVELVPVITLLTSTSQLVQFISGKLKTGGMFMSTTTK